MDSSKTEPGNSLWFERLGAFVWIWLGGRDSNPDNVVQSHVSYR